MSFLAQEAHRKTEAQRWGLESIQSSHGGTRVQTCTSASPPLTPCLSLPDCSAAPLLGKAALGPSEATEEPPHRSLSHQTPWDPF